MYIVFFYAIKQNFFNYKIVRLTPFQVKWRKDHDQSSHVK
jgi:hypothetical protein